MFAENIVSIENRVSPVDCIYLRNADWHRDNLEVEILTGQHFELSCGGYDDDATIIGEIYDGDAVAHFIDIQMGVAGMPAKRIASYQPGKLAEALDAFFDLQNLNRPLYYVGGMMCLRIISKDDLINKIANVGDLDEDDVEDLTARCENCCEDVMDSNEFQEMNSFLGPYGGGDPI